MLQFINLASHKYFLPTLISTLFFRCGAAAQRGPLHSLSWGF